MNRSLYVAIPLLALLALLQTSLWTRFPILGVVPRLSLLAAVAWALLRGTYEGLVWGFLAGIALDVFSLAPVGSTSLAIMLAVVIVVAVQRTLPENPYILPLLLCGLAIAIFLLVHLILVGMAGYGYEWGLVRSLLPTVLLHMVLALPVYWLLRTVEQALYPRPIAV